MVIDLMELVQASHITDGKTEVQRGDHDLILQQAWQQMLGKRLDSSMGKAEHLFKHQVQETRCQ